MDKLRLLGGLLIFVSFTLNYLLSYKGMGFVFGVMAAVGIALLIFGKKLFKTSY